MSQRALVHITQLAQAGKVHDSSLRVLEVLADAATGPQDTAQMSYADLCAAIPLSERQIKTIVKQLKADGYLASTVYRRRRTVAVQVFRFPQLPSGNGHGKPIDITAVRLMAKQSQSHAVRMREDTETILTRTTATKARHDTLMRHVRAWANGQ